MKYDAFLAIAALMNQRLGVMPLLFGSLGLERRLGISLSPDDVDVLIPERCLTGDWQQTIDLMKEAGYLLYDEAEHEFVKGKIQIAFASVESLEPFAGVDIHSIPQIQDQDAAYLLLELSDYLKVYEASSRDSYRKNVKHKQDQQKIELIRRALQKEEHRLTGTIKLSTGRLLLRHFTQNDFDALYEILSDPVTMTYYPAPYDKSGTQRWLDWCLDCYTRYGFGLWAAVLKETGEFIGDCGLTMQNIDGEALPEIGYHIHRRYWRRGYATEAARAVRDWAFRSTDFQALYSYMNAANEASWRTAMANGMKKVKQFLNKEGMLYYAFAITREEWEVLPSVQHERCDGVKTEFAPEDHTDRRATP